MVRPIAFAFNEVTAVTNAFQTPPSTASSNAIVEGAIQEFDDMVKMLRQHQICVTVVEGNGLPDEVFPNNWLVFLDPPRFATFPMCATTRRGERDKLSEVLTCVNETKSTVGIQVIGEGDDQELEGTNEGKMLRETPLLYDISQGIDYAEVNEAMDKYMEGTGSIVFDHENKVAYACLSPRTDETIVREFCSTIDYQPILFTACDQSGTLVYHTNVLMSIGNNIAIICADSISSEKEREMVIENLSKDGKTIVLLSFSQMSEFAGNMLMLPVMLSNSSDSSNQSSMTICVCSTRAYHSLTMEQIDTIELHAKLVHSPLSTIETYGGGSARCMMAEFY